MVFLKRIKELYRLIILLLIVLILYLFDVLKWNKFIGFEKVQKEITSEMEIFGLANKLFGDKMMLLYNDELATNSFVSESIEYGNGYIVYQKEPYLISNFCGSVVKIKENEITISTIDGLIVFSMLKDIRVRLYQKIEIGTKLALLLNCGDEYYYYFEEN